jgi:hypothetical protein
MALRFRFPVFFLATAAAALLVHWSVALLAPPPEEEERKLLPLVYPEAHGYTGKKGSPPHYRPYTLAAGGEPLPLGAVVRTTDAAGVPRGYAGPVPVLVGIDPGGIITGISILDHRETPSYVAGVESRSFLDQFTGRRVTEPLELDNDIDGVSRATVTAEAVTAGVRRASRAAAAGIFGMNVPEEAPWRPPWGKGAALLLVLAVALLSMRGRLRSLRWPCYLASIAVVGFWTGTYLSTESAAKILLWRLPSVTGHLLWYLLVGFAAVAALGWRNIYCARLCPFGALQEVLGLFGRGRLRGSGEEERAARIFRPLFLWLAAMAVFLFGRAEAAGYEPFAAAFDFKGGLLGGAFLGTVLCLALLRHRFWCRWFCPTGFILQMLGRMKTKTPFQESPEG